MDDNKQQIIHYFIEEAQEHLVVVEQGLIELSETIQDAERVNEMFRAAHSVKGGAAMLGFDGIQKTAHKLEDCFKILRDHPVPIDRKLESLFLKGYDALKELVEELATSSTLSLRPEVVERVLAGSAANFVELEDYLNELLNSTTSDYSTATSDPAAATATVGGGTAVMAPPINIVATATEYLKQMLGAFKQGESPASRQSLASICDALKDLGRQNHNWDELVDAAKAVIANPHNNYQTIAPVIIREIKQASELLAENRGSEVVVSSAMQQLATTTAPAVAAPVATAQISIPIDARGAAQAILQNFNRQQVTELVVLLHRAISTPKQN
jgi:chemotaxis protein histidine kinase CheA